MHAKGFATKALLICLCAVPRVINFRHIDSSMASATSYEQTEHKGERRPLWVFGSNHCQSVRSSSWTATPLISLCPRLSLVRSRLFSVMVIHNTRPRISDRPGRVEKLLLTESEIYLSTHGTGVHRDLRSRSGPTIRWSRGIDLPERC